MNYFLEILARFDVSKLSNPQTASVLLRVDSARKVARDNNHQ